MIDLPPPDPAIEIILASRGISKGLAQTDGPQLLVRGEVAFGRFYVGAYAKNVSSPVLDGEVAAMIGVRPQVAGFDLSLTAVYKRSVATVGDIDAEALEVIGAASRSMGPFTPRISLAWSPDDLGSTGRSLFAEAGLSWRIDSHTSFSAAAGRRERTGGPDYTAFNAGVTYSVGRHITLDLRYHDTNRSGAGDPFEARVVGSVRVRF
jgi:uncharacterized protein (TIGR02001 family)